jgi:hypothetical protein
MVVSSKQLCCVICYNGFYGLWGGCESWWKRTCN